MTRYILRRLFIIPPALLLIHFLGFAYAHVARPIRAARTPYVRELVDPTPVWDVYPQHIQDIVTGNLGQMPGGKGEYAETLLRATTASGGLLVLALVVSVAIGLTIGLFAVRTDRPGKSRGLFVFSTLGLAMPSFYLGSLCILSMVYYVIWRGPGSEAPLPIKGFGWDEHLVIPVLALALRPTVQIAQMVADLFSNELGKQYVVATRSFGHTWQNIRWRQVMFNILAPIILTITASFRLLVGELIVVEWLFNWPGLGNLLASTLVPGTLSSSLGSTPLFLNPQVVAALVTIIAALFLVADLVASVAVRVIDPRLRPSKGEQKV
jgi:peptide/nickel transport system permease protein